MLTSFVNEVTQQILLLGTPAAAQANLGCHFCLNPVGPFRHGALPGRGTGHSATGL
jgi:hypothetical protein